eukprot:Em0013g1025a
MIRLIGSGSTIAQELEADNISQSIEKDMERGPCTDSRSFEGNRSEGMIRMGGIITIARWLGPCQLLRSRKTVKLLGRDCSLCSIDESGCCSTEVKLCAVKEKCNPIKQPAADLTCLYFSDACLGEKLPVVAPGCADDPDVPMDRGLEEDCLAGPKCRLRPFDCLWFQPARRACRTSGKLQEYTEKSWQIIDWYLTSSSAVMFQASSHRLGCLFCPFCFLGSEEGGADPLLDWNQGKRWFPFGQPTHFDTGQGSNHGGDGGIEVFYGVGGNLVEVMVPLITTWSFYVRLSRWTSC